MNHYKNEIFRMLHKLNDRENDMRILRQIYAILYKALEKRGKLEQQTSDKSEDIIYINNCLQGEDEEKVKEICMFIKEYCAGDCSE